MVHLDRMTQFVQQDAADRIPLQEQQFVTEADRPLRRTACPARLLTPDEDLAEPKTVLLGETVQPGDKLFPRPAFQPTDQGLAAGVMVGNGAIHGQPPRWLRHHPDPPRFRRQILDAPRLSQGGKRDGLGKRDERDMGDGFGNPAESPEMGLDPASLPLQDGGDPAEVKPAGNHHRQAVAHGQFQADVPPPR